MPRFLNTRDMFAVEAGKSKENGNHEYPSSTAWHGLGYKVFKIRNKRILFLAWQSYTEDGRDLYLKLTAVEMSQRIENSKNIWEATATRQFILRTVNEMMSYW